MADDDTPEDSISGSSGDGTNVADPAVPSSSDIIPVTIEDELKQSYLGYAMSVIIGRALPDIRDGLKPVHRRVLYAMGDMNNTFNRPHVKSARIVGEVQGKYHPHGEAAIYETIVRMAQDFSMRYQLIDGQGNFGSIDADPPAAQRYTEARMTRIGSAMLEDLNLDTVDFSPNYDETLMIPDVLPTRVPNLLINGASGIAVAMATNVPPHNLGEIVGACIALVDDPALSVDELMRKYVKGPDFPTGGIINGAAGIMKAYRTGRGTIFVRARAEIESQASGKESIVVTEIPYQQNKAKLIEKIADLVRGKKIEGITDLRDETSKDGMRVVIELRRGESAEIVLNNLYSQTRLQASYGINCVALVRSRPKTVNLKEMLTTFLEHRREVVMRRTMFRLNQCKNRAHILEGHAVALENINEVVALIQSSQTSAEAREALVSREWKSETINTLLERAGSEATRPEDADPGSGPMAKTVSDGVDNVQRIEAYVLTTAQAQAILDLQLQRLTGIEKGRVIEEYEGIIEQIRDFQEILDSYERLNGVVREELEKIRDRFADERRTEIISTQEDLEEEDLIPSEEVVVTVSRRGYAKIQSLNNYVTQKRGGKGKKATTVQGEDIVEHLLIANTHDTLLCFSNTGKVYWLRVFQVPAGSRISQGRPLVNMLLMEPGERITTLLPIKEYRDNQFIVLATANGTIKRISLSHFRHPGKRGLRALNLVEADTLIGVDMTDGTNDIMLVSSSGLAVRFKESDVRVMGRTARGVRGMRITASQRVVSLIIPRKDGFLLAASENGYGKRTNIDEIPVKGRGIKGMIVLKQTERSVPLAAAVQVFENDEVIFLTDQGKLLRSSISELRPLSRATQGVRLIDLTKGAQLIEIERVVDNQSADIELNQDGEGEEQRTVITY